MTRSSMNSKLTILPVILLLMNCGQRGNNEQTSYLTQLQEVKNQKELAIGDRIELFGGYDYEPKYLTNPPANFKRGKVLSFIDSERGDKSAVVELEENIIGDSITTNIIVIFTRYEGQDWSTNGPVHIELYKEAPIYHFNMSEPKGEWIEVAASYKIL